MILYWTDAGIRTLEFDATVREQHVSTLSITEHPIEKGANVTDHARLELARFTADAIVTNTPIRVPNTAMAGVGGGVRQKTFTLPETVQLPIGIPGVGAAVSALAPPIERTYNANVLQFDSEFDRVRTVFEILRDLQSTATLVSVATSITAFDNMVIRNLSAPRTAEDGSKITFSFDLQEVRFVSTKTVAAPADKKKPVAKVNKGPQPKKEAPLESIAHKGLKGLGFFGGG